MASINYIVEQMQVGLSTGENPLFLPSACIYAFEPLATLEYPPTDQFAVIQPLDIEVNTVTFQTSFGKNPFLLCFHVMLWIFVRLSTDESMQDTLFLQDNINGCLTLTDNVVSFFQSFKVGDPGTTNTLAYEMVDVQFQNYKRSSKGWGVVKMKFKTAFTNH